MLRAQNVRFPVVCSPWQDCAHCPTWYWKEMEIEGERGGARAGMGERAVEAMVERGLQRTAFKRRIAEHGGFQQQLARARVRLDAARLTVLDAAHALDLVGNKQVRPHKHPSAPA